MYVCCIIFCVYVRGYKFGEWCVLFVVVVWVYVEGVYVCFVIEYVFVCVCVC